MAVAEVLGPVGQLSHCATTRVQLQLKFFVTLCGDNVEAFRPLKSPVLVFFKHRSLALMRKYAGESLALGMPRVHFVTLTGTCCPLGSVSVSLEIGT